MHVVLRQLPSTPDMHPNQIKVELSVVDTGKGISQDFLKVSFSSCKTSCGDLTTLLLF